jgi:hypothetical protein
MGLVNACSFNFWFLVSSLAFGPCSFAPRLNEKRAGFDGFLFLAAGQALSLRKI